jgi:Collagen triple helix repeat (20 copies)
MKSGITARFNKPGLFLLIMSLVVGGAGAQASGVLNSPSGGYLVCVNSKTKVVTHPGSTSCPKGSDKLILGAQGAAGVDGLAGAAGIAGKDGLNGKDGKTLWNGVKDPESTWGAPGDMFINSVTKTLFGPKNLDGTWPVGVSMVGAKGDQGPIGLTGATGPQGPQGPGGSGPAGPQGPAGATGANGAAGPAGANGVAAPIATGSNCILTKCTYKIGDTGPGGGIIFFVDYNDQYSGFDYLEAAPTSCASTVKPWSSFSTWIMAPVNTPAGWAAHAVGAGKSNTTAIISAYATENILGYPSPSVSNNAAYFAASCSVGGKSDWFLGSLGEMKLIYDNLPGLGSFAEADYWTSSSGPASNNYSLAISFLSGVPAPFDRTNNKAVRPIRSF